MDVAYEGFGDKALGFLKALGFHQSREWFHDNKAMFEEEVNEPRMRLVDSAAARLADEKIPLTGSRKTSIYRINRDVRFSKDKSPYNTHVSGLLTRTGTKKDQGFLYFHVQPDNSFLAAGFYGMEPDELRAFRETIIARPSQYREAVAPFAAIDYAPEDINVLKRLPKGFESVTDPDLQAVVRRRNLVFSRPFGPERLRGTVLVDDIATLAHAAMPFLNFGWRIIDPVRQGREEKNR